MIRVNRIFLLATLALTGWASAARANLVENPSFELGEFVNDAFNYDLLEAGSDHLQGWTIVEEVAWALNPADGFQASDGAGFVDLSSFGSDSPNGAIEQVIATVPGTRYVVEVDQSGAVSQVLVDGAELALEAVGSTGDWVRQRGYFVAAAATATLRLANSSNSGIVFVDNVTVEVDDGVPELAGLSLKRSSVAGCKSVSGTVTLSSVAPAGGLVVTLSDDLASATAPVTVKVPEGKTSKNFSLKTIPVAVSEVGEVSATLGGTTLSQSLTVRPMALLSIALAPTSVVGGGVVAATAKLECKAGPGDILVELGSTNAAVANPAVPSVVVPAGTQSVPFTVTTAPVIKTTKPKIVGTANGVSKSRTLAVTP